MSKHMAPRKRKVPYDHKKPLVYMKPEELDECFRDIGESLDRGVLEGARADRNGPWKIVYASASGPDGRRILYSLMDYGDGEHESYVHKHVDEARAKLKRGESVEVKEMLIDVSTIRSQVGPVFWPVPEEEETAVAVVVTFLRTTDGKEHLVTADVDFGELDFEDGVGCGMAPSLKWVELVADRGYLLEGEKLYVGMCLMELP